MVNGAYNVLRCECTDFYYTRRPKVYTIDSHILKHAHSHTPVFE